MERVEDEDALLVTSGGYKTGSCYNDGYFGRNVETPLESGSGVSKLGWAD